MALIDRASLNLFLEIEAIKAEAAEKNRAGLRRPGRLHLTQAHGRKRAVMDRKNVYLVYAPLVYLVYTRLMAPVLRACDCPGKERLAKAVYLRYLGRST